MGRPKNALNVTEPERQRIRELFAQGVRIAEIIRRTGRSESVVSRAVRGLKRPKPAPKARNSKRDALIVKRVAKEGMTVAAAARRFGLTPTRVCEIVRIALRLRPKRRRKRDSVPTPQLAPQPAAEARRLTRAQRGARDRLIARLAGEGVAQAALARRFQLSLTTIRRILERRAGRRASGIRGGR